MTYLLHAPRYIVSGIIQLYRLVVSPLFPLSCIYTPTCSRYALTAVQRYGVVKGGCLAARRILRCHPWRNGGHDPVQ